MLWLSRAELILVLCSGLSDCFSASSHSLPSPFLPEQQNQSREVHFIVLGLLPPPAVAADLLLMSKVARGCHLPRGGSSPCTVGLIFFFFFLCKLHVQPCLRVLLILSMLSLEKLFFNRRTVFANLPPSWKEQGGTGHDPDTV